MKTIALILIVLTAATAGHTQSVNWNTIHDRPNQIRIGTGYDYGVSMQIGYSRAFTLLRPLQLDLDVTLPTGGDVVDDLKTSLGAQVEVIAQGPLSATIRVASLFRRYESALVRSVSFGSDMGIVAGYYGAWWHAAGEFGFDKAIATHIRQTDISRPYAPPMHAAWYVPTGGHYYYGVQTGATVADAVDIGLRAGATNAQFDDENAALPYYLQLTVGTRF